MTYQIRAQVSSGAAPASSSALAINVGFLFRELPFLDRFPAVRMAGFRAVEFPWPPSPEAQVVRTIERTELAVVLVNMPAGDLEAGDRGFTNSPSQRLRWQGEFRRALDFARRVDCPTINVLAGNLMAGVSIARQLACVRDNLSWAAELAARYGRRVVLEVLNPVDNPRYLLPRIDQAADMIAPLMPALMLQFDTYHVARITGDPVDAFRRVADSVGHIQLADFPGRHEPGSGAIPFDTFLQVVRRSGFCGGMALEYIPSTSTEESLRRLPECVRSLI
jgi:hydroxypyruvate isomerase